MAFGLSRGGEDPLELHVAEDVGREAETELAASGGSSEFVWGPPAGDCPDCGAAGIPSLFSYCGACGASLNAAEKAPVGGDA